MILALSTTVEGETTSSIYRDGCKRAGSPSDFDRSRIGSNELDYADDLTIAHALHNRRPLIFCGVFHFFSPMKLGVRSGGFPGVPFVVVCIVRTLRRLGKWYLRFLYGRISG